MGKYDIVYIKVEKYKMQTFHVNGDNKRFYFRNLNGLSDDEEFKGIMAILMGAGCKIGEPETAPNCDIISCKYRNRYFKVIRAIDGDGNYIYADDPVVLADLEELFK